MAMSKPVFNPLTMTKPQVKRLAERSVTALSRAKREGEALNLWAMSVGALAGQAREGNLTVEEFDGYFTALTAALRGVLQIEGGAR